MKQLRPYQAIAVKDTWESLKKNDDPVLLMASVGAGKSIMIASILLTMQKAGKRALCIVNNAELVRNNCATFQEQGGNASIYCAALQSKDTSGAIVFGTPQSILNGINKNEDIGRIKFNLIVVDEAHAINYLNHISCFMRILRHYKQEYPAMRLLGATGTNFRYKGAAIVGEDCLFKYQTGNITTHRLIEDGFLVKPVFEIDDELVIDFSRVKLKRTGQFDHKELGKVIERSTRLTEVICAQIVHIMKTKQRCGVFLFATTKKHAYEILSHLPADESAIILGDTPQDERTEILSKARCGQVRYIVNIAIISVGVDIPAFDTIAYLRPTESLVLLVQTMGRGLRLSNDTAKTSCLVLDFAGNIQRHSDWDDPILLDALIQTIDKNKPLIILCPDCQTMNTDTARRCVGFKNEKRCDYYFEFKECPNPVCKVKNDITSRQCRLCEAEIIDPNAKLSLAPVISALNEVEVTKARYGISHAGERFTVVCHYTYKDKLGDENSIKETFTPSSDKARNVFYGNFVRKHCDRPHEWYMHLNKRDKIEEMLLEVNTPLRLALKHDESGFKIHRKYFA